MPMPTAVSRLQIAKLVLTAATLAMAPLAQAQNTQAQETPDEAANDGNAIIVQGERVDSRDIRNTARDITVGSQAISQPLPRFQRPVCPGIWGLPAEIAQSIIDRIYDNAEAAGIEMNAEPECDANVWLIFVDDPEQTFAQLRDERSFMTRHLTRYQLREIEDQVGSARAWNLITSRNEDGQRVPTGFEYRSLAAQARASGLPGPSVQVRSPSRIQTGIRQDLEMSVALIERSALVELDTYAVADYATMRLLSYTRPPGNEDAVSTILTLFEPDMEAYSPHRLTEFDMAYLQALYRSNEFRPARMAIGSISDLIREGAP
ncbi:hypothetical protein AAV99_12795 [Aurantiacibacter marinus]|uniref:Uncharacterized protein n=2 Tax=Aurantiacibacter marinus TaxID=874156 RepID=A0A0H0XKS2_9SPHN|nr:hypothetical protein AAV99_12795 [Aurantiacibacter marinus]